jgi:uncharacterized protein (DUF2236 family)
VAWRATSDLRLNVAVLYPLILQVAYPTVDAGVSDHSDFEHRPLDRLMRTMDYVSLVVYGGREAVVAGRRLRELHKRPGARALTARTAARSSPRRTPGCTPRCLTPTCARRLTSARR